MTWPAVLAMDEPAFVHTFGGIYEHSPWLAKVVFDEGLESTDGGLDAVHRKFSACLSKAHREQQLELIRTHPDLAGKAALAGRVTASSAAEQQSAGLDQCSERELARFKRLNGAYLDKFGFPFIIAVKGLNRIAILKAFEQRLDNSAATEFACALDQINRIARLRLEAL